MAGETQPRPVDHHDETEEEDHAADRSSTNSEEGDDGTAASSAKNVGRKRLIDETTLDPTERKKLESRRAYNRQCAAKARKRSKDLVSQLQSQVEELIKEKAELKRSNDVMKAQLELLEQQNRVLMMSQLNAQGAAAAAAAGLPQQQALQQQAFQQPLQQQQAALVSLGSLSHSAGSANANTTSNSNNCNTTSTVMPPSLSLIDRLTLERLAANQNNLFQGQAQLPQQQIGAFGGLDTSALSEVLGIGNQGGKDNSNNGDQRRF